MSASMSDVALREYLEHRIEELDKRVQQRFEQDALAIETAQRTMNERLNGMNEFRNSLKDQSANMVTRIEFTQFIERLRIIEVQAQHDLNEVRRLIAMREGSLSGMGALIAVTISVGGFVLLLVNFFLKNR